MKSRHLKGKVGAIVLSSFMLFGVWVASGVTAQAQWPAGDRQWQREREYRREQRRREREQRRDARRYDRRSDRSYGNNSGYGYGDYNNRSGDTYPNYGGSFQLRQTALNAGYNNGLEEGRRDRQRNARYEFRDSSKYQNATEDYNSRYGDRGLYQQYFRLAFQRGYDAGYNGY